MTFSQVFLIFAIAIIAPHVQENDAKILSLGCAAIALVIYFIELRLKP
jgi:hypothetical protein